MVQPEPFPWHLGVFDAHCHPTDTMSSIPAMPTMKTRCLTVMATRSQDQALVAQTAERYGVRSADPERWSRDECMVPCFGWHPWFAHMMYIDDSDPDSDSEEHDEARPSPGKTTPEKLGHYTRILQPTPTAAQHALLTALPAPLPFSTFLAQTRAYLETHPYALIGEIGLDRSFRVPDPSSTPTANASEGLTPGRRDGRKLLPFRCTAAHQKRIFRRQLRLAGEMGRAVSVHGVQAHGLVFEVLREGWKGVEGGGESKRARKRRLEREEAERRKKEGDDDDEATPAEQEKESKGKNTNDTRQKNPPRICLHSYSAPATHLQSSYLPLFPNPPPQMPKIYFSFSTAINLPHLPAFPSSSPSSTPDADYADYAATTPPPFLTTLRLIPDDRILVESDLHTAGPEMDARLEEIVRRVCWVKGWGLEEGVERLKGNWRGFVFG